MSIDTDMLRDYVKFTRATGLWAELAPDTLEALLNERDKAEAQRDGLAEVLEDMLDLHDPHGEWERDEGHLNEVVAMRVTAAAEALREIKEEP